MGWLSLCMLRRPLLPSPLCCSAPFRLSTQCIARDMQCPAPASTHLHDSCPHIAASSDHTNSQPAAPVAQEGHDAEDCPAGHLTKEAEGVKHRQLQDQEQFNLHRQTGRRAGRWATGKSHGCFDEALGISGTRWKCRIDDW
jgi:hypothetical protein